MIDWRFKINSETDIRTLVELMQMIQKRVQTLHRLKQVPKVEIVTEQTSNMQIVEAK